ncbi:hypothetical protein TNCV_670781 [Trichonephila clavipes]|nr:hypothetical protein TNCV_670781 [Trichonephila clavipes]
MPDIKTDDNCLFEVERRLNVYLNSDKLEQLENQHAEKLNLRCAALELMQRLKQLFSVGNGIFCVVTRVFCNILRWEVIFPKPKKGLSPIHYRTYLRCCGEKDYSLPFLYLYQVLTTASLKEWN